MQLTYTAILTVDIGSTFEQSEIIVFFKKIERFFANETIKEKKFDLNYESAIRMP